MVAHAHSTTVDQDAVAIRTPRAARSSSRRPILGATLWTVQGLLALLFLFAGVVKFFLPMEMLEQGGLPGAFVLFIGAAEALGALGLILPGVLRIKPGLTPLAAAGLTIIMLGATVTTLAIGAGAGALFPLVVAVLTGFVAHGRWRLAPTGGALR